MKKCEISACVLCFKNFMTLVKTIGKRTNFCSFFYFQCWELEKLWSNICVVICYLLVFQNKNKHFNENPSLHYLRCHKFRLYTWYTDIQYVGLFNFGTQKLQMKIWDNLNLRSQRKNVFFLTDLLLNTIYY